jgi:hypothetical protein
MLSNTHYHESLTPAIMKKLLLVLLILGLPLATFAGIKEKDVLGTWKYKVETDQGELTGVIKIELKDDALVAEVNTDEGEVLPFSKVEIKENDILYMEIDTGYEILELSLTVKGKVMEGTVGNEQGSFPITCEKTE